VARDYHHSGISRSSRAGPKGLRIRHKRDETHQGRRARHQTAADGATRTGAGGQRGIWCALTSRLTPKQVRALRAAGQEVWWYICCVPKSPYVTEFIDHPASSCAVALAIVAIRGARHPGLGNALLDQSTAYPEPQLQDPWQDPMSWKGGYGTPIGEKRPWGNGDGRFLYPPRRDRTSRKPRA